MCSFPVLQYYEQAQKISATDAELSAIKYHVRFTFERSGLAFTHQAINTIKNSPSHIQTLFPSDSFISSPSAQAFSRYENLAGYEDLSLNSSCEAARVNAVDGGGARADAGAGVASNGQLEPLRGSQLGESGSLALAQSLNPRKDHRIKTLNAEQRHAVHVISSFCADFYFSRQV